MATSVKMKKIYSLLIILVFELVVIGIYFWTKRELAFYEKIQAIGKSAEAKLVEFNTSKDTKNGITTYTYAPIVAYQVNGKNYRLESSMNSKKENLPAIGESMKVIYNPNNPEEAIFGGEYGALFTKNTALINKIVMIIGGVLVLVAILVMTAKRFEEK